MAQEALNAQLKYAWQLRIDGLKAGQCQEFKIPDKEKSVARYGAGILPDVKVPTKIKVGEAEVKGLVLKDNFFHDWLIKGDKRLVIFELTDLEGKITRKYELQECFVSKTAIDNLVYKDEGTEFLMETITLQVRDYTVTLG
jgi:hypothetical protein